MLSNGTSLWSGNPWCFWGKPTGDGQGIVTYVFFKEIKYVLKKVQEGFSDIGFKKGRPENSTCSGLIHKDQNKWCKSRLIFVIKVWIPLENVKTNGTREWAGSWAV